ncbi:MAG: hypothetical protein RIQ78_281 [Bacteroidota bacterium]|jgi:hypothetical protein
MKYETSTPTEYVNAVDELRREAFAKLRDTILEHLPAGYKEGMGYGMIGYSVPHDLYPAGYHCDPKMPLPFVSIAAQKNFISLYHMGLYLDPVLFEWFVGEYPRHCKGKLDMGKSCIRFKKASDIPYELIGQLMQKISVALWVELYEARLKA